ncbi:uncharacterized protein LOC126903941 isoform X6 [Daktulosphaira vitifoliae]|uniref:uncharacterized protein LOC126903941 isoform X1 n=1 Tax=Daktulosphaira vitifoliae TaxID=58002 RepID=UPI0021AA4232|nr:uncharacterized protein LOC126903941 isoform X1 [Daktulosphaira vitifoliae]XP_050538481.1 uncharacterized protein LOC126903941 isoform X2 [Daktulosphaira vitifoliae]XP_050538482.1 uncharacterized protein LOC126903941 isoform X3 [Daktulosphaira vitifoliae]XP_050538483.1 uncharacterized protein LOC126903941 isoform X3 [Daktulosphaira vitifoliae]XP_050538484.1 uncharacterized protein LOC126903941 isoform X3 [Daktulosphaira vitifoliae]XP_050538487.1 uncharacterized protein LOC126903941 isoform 
MFSDIVDNLNLNLESFSNLSDVLFECENMTEEIQKEHERLNNVCNEINNDLLKHEEQLSYVERERVKLMSELALNMQTNHDIKNKVENLKNTQQSIEFDYKKFNRMKASSTDIDKLSHIKKTFITYKNMLKIHFDYSNGLNAIVQKGYMYNRITMKLTYFEFNTETKSADEITKYLWNKIQKISDKNWESIN